MCHLIVLCFAIVLALCTFFCHGYGSFTQCFTEIHMDIFLRGHFLNPFEVAQTPQFGLKMLLNYS